MILGFSYRLVRLGTIKIIQMNLQILTNKKQLINVAVISVIIIIYFWVVFFESLISKYPHGADCFTHYYELLHIKKLFLKTSNFHNLIDHFSEAVNFVYFDIKRPPLFYIITLAVNSIIPDLFLVANYIIPFVYFIITVIFTFKKSSFFCEKNINTLS